MIFTETKRNVLIGVLTGILAGFVLGAFFGLPDSDFRTGKGNASGDIARIANLGKFTAPSGCQEEKAAQDTVRYEAADTDGNNIEILIIKGRN